jgi:hypothetical protein
MKQDIAFSGGKAFALDELNSAEDDDIALP